MNYRVKMAVCGDYSRYTSKPLHDFIYESNQGNNFFFVATKEEAAEKLANAELSEITTASAASSTRP